MRFGSIDMFMDFNDWGFRIGRPVANEGFLKALLTYGGYDAYEFFCPDSNHLNMFIKKIKELITDPNLLDRIKVNLRIALSESIGYRKYDIFHLGDFTYFTPYLVYMRNRCTGHPFPITGITHSLDSVEMNLRYLELAISGMASFDGIICTSSCAFDSVKKGLARTYELLTGNMFEAGPRLKKIPLGIENEFFIETDKRSARAFFNIPEDVIVALSVGRLSIRKKTDWSPLLEMFSRVYSSGSWDKLIFILAGGAEDSDVALFESLISRAGLNRRVMLLPNFKPDIKRKLFRAADIYLSPVDNFQETFGINIIEAMASGLPVIASDFSGYRDLVKDGKDGFLIPTTWSDGLPEFLKDNIGILDPSILKLYLSQTISLDFDELHNAIDKLYTNKDFRKVMGLAAGESALSYRWENIIGSYEEFWQELSKESYENRRPDIYDISDILMGDFEHLFSHYPSRISTDNDIASITEIGRNILDGSHSLIRIEDVAPCLFSDLEELILKGLADRDQSIGEIKQQAEERLEATYGQTGFHLQWLYKHGALRFRRSPQETVAR